jgi:hypothetical protein
MIDVDDFIIDLEVPFFQPAFQYESWHDMSRTLVIFTILHLSYLLKNGDFSRCASPRAIED